MVQGNLPESMLQRHQLRWWTVFFCLTSLNLISVLNLKATNLPHSWSPHWTSGYPDSLSLPCFVLVSSELVGLWLGLWMHHSLANPTLWLWAYSKLGTSFSNSDMVPDQGHLGHRTLRFSLPYPLPSLPAIQTAVRELKDMCDQSVAVPTVSVRSELVTLTLKASTSDLRILLSVTAVVNCWLASESCLNRVAFSPFSCSTWLWGKTSMVTTHNLAIN